MFLGRIHRRRQVRAANLGGMKTEYQSVFT